VKKRLLNKYSLAFCAGLVAVAGFAPFLLFPLPIFSLAVLFVLWLTEGSARKSFRLGFVFGLGLFGAGVGWIYVALHDYGDMPVLLALLATFLFASVLALFPALAGLAQAKLKGPMWVRLTLVMPAMWALLEWLRGTVFTGFPWLAFGYSQVSESPLAGFAPVLGVYGVSLAAAISAGLFALLWFVRWSGLGKAAIALLAALWLTGVALREAEWTEPSGEPFKVSLVQGNIPQELKFEQDRLVGTLETYRRLVEQSDARLIVLPETAIPLLRSEAPESYLSLLRDHARQNGGDILMGLFEREGRNYYNSVLSTGVSPDQGYRKDHLVPFGEFIPLRPVFGWLINNVLNIPMSDLARGGGTQAPLAIAGQKVAPNICYEDVFGEEIIRALPEATVLVNVSNDAWYGNSSAAMQHNQISQMRALETGRMMLRATNTGVTSVIGKSGHILQILPQHEEGVLNGEVQGYSGSTPYVRWGNAAVLMLLGLMLVLAVLKGANIRRRVKNAAAS
jgi:apolipoprotein N-acyltransferase